MLTRNKPPHPDRAYHAWKLEQIEEGRAAADRGDVVSHDDLFARLRRRFTPGEH